ncbi:MAG: RES family NAD+ phosphorylase [Salinivirgaceae bacterium]|jgi:hypothetical protein|nr:RES family NAD+ phosphorylase [Salinivirgaceae bacterium]
MHTCPNCFKDLELIKYIESNSIVTGNCDFCGTKSALLLEIVELLDFFEDFFNVFEADTKGINMVDIIHNDWHLFKNKTVTKKFIQGLSLLIDYPYDHQKNRIVKVKYVPEITDNVSYWTIFKDEIKWQQRFVLPLENLKELGWDNFFNDKVEYKDNVSLFRARIHHKENQLAFGYNEMGCPEKESANGGRANPQGIPYLYLSKELETTFYETRVLFKDEVSVGEFKVINGEYVYLVDFTEEASAFQGFNSPDSLVRYTQKILLKQEISKDLSKPIRRYDSEIEYIPTQFICEFIRYMSKVDGIIFNSSLHANGKNIVLFNFEKVSCISVKKYVIDSLKIKEQILS